MIATTELWDEIAALIDYPRSETYADRASRCAAHAAGSGVAAALVQFRDRIAGRSLGSIQERYVAVFDCDPACTPELGWHLYAERPDRGAWLATLREELARAGVEESGELPDHLGHLLQLIPRVDDERARQLAAQIAPVVEQIRDRLAERNHEFTALLDAAAAMLRARLAGGGGAP